jgi:hypothetical protein
MNTAIPPSSLRLPVHARTDAGRRTCPRRRFALVARDRATGLENTSYARGILAAVQAAARAISRPLCVIPEGAGPVKSRLVVCIDVLSSLSGVVFARRDRRWCPGSAEGRPRSGRRPWTPAPRGACCVRADSDRVGLRIPSRVLGVSAPSPGSPGRDRRGGCRSFLRRVRRHGVMRQGAVGWGHSSGGDHAGELGVRHKRDPRPTAFGWLMRWW